MIRKRNFAEGQNRVRRERTRRFFESSQSRLDDISYAIISVGDAPEVKIARNGKDIASFIHEVKDALLSNSGKDLSNYVLDLDDKLGDFEIIDSYEDCWLHPSGERLVSDQFDEFIIYIIFCDDNNEHLVELSTEPEDCDADIGEDIGYETTISGRVDYTFSVFVDFMEDEIEETVFSELLETFTLTFYVEEEYNTDPRDEYDPYP
jgi:hypothetical protein